MCEKSRRTRRRELSNMYGERAMTTSNPANKGAGLSGYPEFLVSMLNALRSKVTGFLIQGTSWKSGGTP